ncbi:type II toxin-antitoxin system HicB family antitoxin [Komagataeibacter sp. FNDCF1]|uniref:type II toxin-antitoxin system HicB family antitoxin n=1 Tax=Komagataeibacter sp. FNDCF1 TaxID=2878681 RepID=UPI001E514BCC|nr:type II toxin-antitoxin system HicB family antitoxin [Komagataeibacter sp. FNDCF1]MCE2564179.1 type II toxin-antitoxin system HicB family antitoxin [Komagataeibacter sp. FNDCF1]
MRYPIVIERGSETTAYGVIVPDLPGCFSAGDTFEEAMNNAPEAITLWIECALDYGESIPAPSPLDVLMNNPEWSGPEWVWAFAQVDPALLDETPEHISVTLPRRVLLRLDAQAGTAGEARSDCIARLILNA